MYMDEMNRPPQPPRVPRMGLAVASLVLGCMAVFMSFLLIGILLGLIGVVLGGIHILSEKQHRAMAGGGIFLSGLGTVMGIGFAVLYTFLVQDVMPSLDYEYYGNEHLSQWEGVRAPDLTLTDLDGNEYTLSELQGKRVVLFLFSTWSGDEQVEYVNQLVNDEAAGELVVIGISGDELEDLTEYLDGVEVNFPVVAEQDLPSPYGDTFELPVSVIIDRNGVIQHVETHYNDINDYESLRELALADDFSGTPLDSLPTPRDGLLEGAAPLHAAEVWSVEVGEPSSLETGDLDGDGIDEILVCTWDSEVIVLRADGSEMKTFDVPETVTHVALLAHESGPRLLGFSRYEESVFSLDLDGNAIWEYAPGWLPVPVEDVHWGDMDGDGNDEIAISTMNGLHLVSEDGERVWRNRSAASGSIAVVASDREGARVYSGQFSKVTVVDAAGETRNSFVLNGMYGYGMHGIQLSPEGPTQLLFNGDGEIFAGTPEGEILWRAPVYDGEEWYPEVFCAFGDVNGDGVQEWLFIEDNGDLTAVSQEGAREASVSGLENVVSYGIAQQTGGENSLIVLKSDAVVGYAFRPGRAPETAVDSDSGVVPEAIEQETDVVAEPSEDGESALETPLEDGVKP